MIELALVGDFVGAGIIEAHPNPSAEDITYRDAHFALTGCPVSVHLGPAHPTTPLSAFVNIGLTQFEIGEDGLKLLAIGSLATCGDPIFKNPSVVDLLTRESELQLL